MSKVVDDSADETNFPHKLLSNDTHKYWGFVKLLQIVHQLIKIFLKVPLLKMVQLEWSAYLSVQNIQGLLVKKFINEIIKKALLIRKRI